MAGATLTSQMHLHPMWLVLLFTWTCGSVFLPEPPDLYVFT